jgi:Cu/Zn superoxide dismutase
VAEWQQRRLESLDDRPVQIHEGTDNTTTTKPTGGPTDA